MHCWRYMVSLVSQHNFLLYLPQDPCVLNFIRSWQSIRVLYRMLFEFKIVPNKTSMLYLWHMIWDFDNVVSRNKQVEWWCPACSFLPAHIQVRVVKLHRLVWGGPPPSDSYLPPVPSSVYIPSPLLVRTFWSCWVIIITVFGCFFSFFKYCTSIFQLNSFCKKTKHFYTVWFKKSFGWNYRRTRFSSHQLFVYLVH